jgi:uncharacterized membrane protein YeaQ/YmgE (transglycosylase-associated protein family)
MNWTDILKGIAPTLASAALGPLGGVLVAGLGSAMGIDSPTQDKISKAFTNGQLTPEALEKIRALELQYQNDEKERGFKYAELEFKDRDSARNREVQTGDNTTKLLAFIIVGAFVGTVAATLAGWTKAESVLAGTLIGYLSAKAEQVLSYYFGSNKDSSRKTELLANSTQSK